MESVASPVMAFYPKNVIHIFWNTETQANLRDIATSPDSAIGSNDHSASRVSLPTSSPVIKQEGNIKDEVKSEMSSSARLSSMLGVVNHEPRSVNYPTVPCDTGCGGKRPAVSTEIFGTSVFTLKEMQRRLPKPVFKKYLKQMRGQEQMDKVAIDAIAHAVRVWAQERGATHFTHWFQPLTGATAEKHDSFLSVCTGASGEPVAFDAFSGSQLLQSEPDASSFPSGGTRTTFEARGYTIWDTSSPMFIRPGALAGSQTLYIPCVFISYNGEALDEKTVVLRSQEALAERARHVLNLIGNCNSSSDKKCSESSAACKKDSCGTKQASANNCSAECKDSCKCEQNCCGKVQRVVTTLGCEQEFFLVDRALYQMRMDLKLTGRTLLGRVPPKHQQLEDHYFGKIPSRVLATIAEAECELMRLGVPVKTRHNEVAPAQFEMAPIFEEAAVAIDHNLLVMDVLEKVAHRHKLKVLFHEKPFSGVNGSGKHCNWSMSTDTGENLLDPGSEPERNNRFLICLLAVLLGVHKHQGLLRAAISSASNDHRLGANEAPPAIISAFLGRQLDEVLANIESDRQTVASPLPTVKSIKLGGRALDLDVAVLPEIQRDLTDRNRTSPLAFTGNKFEFRAVGSRQSPALPVAMLNAAAASGFLEVSEMLEKAMAAEKQQAGASGACEFASEKVQRQLIRELVRRTRSIRFEGDNYSERWRTEAAQRKLLIVASTPDAYDQLLEPENLNMLTERTNIFAKKELQMRHHVLMERYAKDVLIEANTLLNLIDQSILPSAFEYRKMLADTVGAIKHAVGGEGAAPEASQLSATSPVVSALQGAACALRATINLIEATSMPTGDLARRVCSELVPLMTSARHHADELERLIADKYWPMPKYTEILFT